MVIIVNSRKGSQQFLSNTVRRSNIRPARLSKKWGRDREKKTGKRNEKKKLSLCGRHPCIVPGPAHSCLRPYPLRAKRLAKQRLSRKASNSFCATHTHTHCGTHISSSLWKLLKERKAKDRAEGEGAEREGDSEHWQPFSKCCWQAGQSHEAQSLPAQSKEANSSAEHASCRQA